MFCLTLWQKLKDLWSKYSPSSLEAEDHLYSHNWIDYMLIIWPGWKYETKLFFLLQKIISHTEQKPIIRKQIGFWKTFLGPLLPLSMFQMYCQRKWFQVLCLPRQSSAACWCLISMEFASVNSLADHINELDNKTALSELLATFVYLKVEHFFKFRTRLTTICDWYIEFREHVHNKSKCQLHPLSTR